MSTKAGRPPIFSPHPAQHRFVADAEGTRDAPDAQAVQVGAGDLILELLVVAGTLGLENERAPARQALGSLIPVFGVTVLAKMLAAAAPANVDDGRGKHPQTSPLICSLATVRFSPPKLPLCNLPSSQS